MLDIKFTFIIKMKMQYFTTCINVNGHKGKVEDLSDRCLISKIYKCKVFAGESKTAVCSLTCYIGIEY